MTVTADCTTFLDSENCRGAARARRYCLGVTLLVVVAIPVAVAAQQPPALRPGDIVMLGAESREEAEPSLRVRGRLTKIDPATGVRTILSDFGDLSQGPTNPIPVLFDNDPPGALAIQDATAIFVAHPFFGTDAKGALFRVEPSTGVRTILSDFGNPAQGPPVGTGNRSDYRLAIESSGDFLVLDRSREALVRVNQLTGTRTIASDFGNPVQGPVLDVDAGSDLTVDESGLISVIADVSLSTRAVFLSIHPTACVR
jgi:hypothetical protein